MDRIKTMKKLLVLILAAFLVHLPLTAAEAQESTAQASPAGGILKLSEDFSVFPENKLGNSIYYNGKKLISRDDLTMIGITKAPEGFIYHGLDETGNSVLGYTGNPDAKFIPLQGGFYQLITSTDTKRKLYWINGDGEIEDLLPRRNTGTGLVFNGVDKAAFYHISKGETIETESGRERYQYTFRIHVADRSTYRVRHLPISVKDFTFRLRLEWMDENTIKYTLSNGQVETVAIR